MGIHIVLTSYSKINISLLCSIVHITSSSHQYNHNHNINNEKEKSIKSNKIGATIKTLEEGMQSETSHSRGHNSCKLEIPCLTYKTRTITPV